MPPTFKLTLKFLPEARAEFVHIVDWYLWQAGKPVALRFQEQMEKSLHTIAEHPERWPKLSPLIHRYKLSRFPFNILYTYDKSTIHIVAIAHTSRRPGYWQSRLGERSTGYNQ